MRYDLPREDADDALANAANAFWAAFERARPRLTQSQVEVFVLYYVGRRGGPLTVREIASDLGSDEVDVEADLRSAIQAVRDEGFPAGM